MMRTRSRGLQASLRRRRSTRRARLGWSRRVYLPFPWARNLLTRTYRTRLRSPRRRRSLRTSSAPLSTHASSVPTSLKMCHALRTGELTSCMCSTWTSTCRRCRWTGAASGLPCFADVAVTSSGTAFIRDSPHSCQRCLGTAWQDHRLHRAGQMSRNSPRIKLCVCFPGSGMVRTFFFSELR